MTPNTPERQADDDLLEDMLYLTGRETPKDELIINEINGSDFDRTNSVERHHQSFSHLFEARDHLNILIGSDSGLLIRNIVDSDPPEGTRYLFIELPEVIAWLEANAPALVSELPEHVFLATAENWLEVAKAASINNYAYLGNIRPTESLGAAHDHVDRYTQISWAVEESIKTMLWKIQSTLGSAQFVKRQILNLSEARQPAATLKDRHKGQNALLLAGGPSLDKILPWVKENRAQLILIAVSRISRRLVEVGISPDYVVSVDPHDVSFLVSKEMLSFSEETRFVYANHVNSRLLRNWPYRSYYMGNLFPWKSSIDKTNNMNGPGPTVTNSALELAFHLGISKVLLCGVDLCFDDGGSTHAKGSVEAQLGPNLMQRTIVVTTYDGRSADTTIAYKEAADSINSQAKRHLRNGMRTYNFSRGAVALENVAPADQPKEFLNPVDTEPSTPQHHRDEASIEKIKEELGQAIYSCQQISQQAKKARELNKKFFEGTPETAIASRKARIEIDKIEKSFKRRFRHHARLIRQLGVREFLKITSLGSSRDLEDFERAERDLDRYYGAYEAGARTLLEWLEKSADMIDQRLLESKKLNASSIKILKDLWIEQGTPARYLRYTHDIERCCPEILEDLREDLEKLLNNKDELVSHSRSKFNPVRGLEQAHSAFVRKDDEALARIGKYIGASKWHSNSELYETYVRGLNEQRRENYAEAIRYFEPIISEPYEPLLEHALRQTASCYLALGLGEQAIQALEILSSFNPMYRKQLIAALLIAKRYEEAVLVAEAHIGQFPTDLGMMYLLGKTYAQQGAREAALMMTRHILSQDPTHKPTIVLERQLASA
ncbi:MAG: 6-hydroxymethylpterin diphosphokinase MptE-like protein [Halothiobacillaceae bacterium]